MINTVIFDYGNTLCEVGSLAASLPAVFAHPRALEIGQHIEQRIVDLYQPNQVDQPQWEQIWQDAFARHDAPFSRELGIQHLQHFCASGRLYDYTLPVLNALKQRGITTILLSNATGPADVFTQDLQQRGLDKYFDGIIWSSACGYRKPSVQAFDYALNAVGSPCKSAVLMVGDNETADIEGAQRYGVRSVRVCDNLPADSVADFIFTREEFGAALLLLK
ncbi:HAD family hydrolase [Endozoicomonadaceae bacterium StTr2]